jgi:hypothetical protein
LWSPPPPPVPEEKPLNTSVTMSLDPSKGGFMALAAAQILSQKGIQLDLDAIAEAQNLITQTTPKENKIEGGMLPPRADSYPYGDYPKKNLKKKKSKEDEYDE